MLGRHTAVPQQVQNFREIPRSVIDRTHAVSREDHRQRVSACNRQKPADLFINGPIYFLHGVGQAVRVFFRVALVHRINEAPEMMTDAMRLRKDCAVPLIVVHSVARADRVLAEALLTLRSVAGVDERAAPVACAPQLVIWKPSSNLPETSVHQRRQRASRRGSGNPERRPMQLRPADIQAGCFRVVLDVKYFSSLADRARVERSEDRVGAVRPSAQRLRVPRSIMAEIGKHPRRPTFKQRPIIASK
jgi:hypothetical protein